MSSYSQELFWAPDELGAWLRRTCARFDLWLVIWRAGRNAEPVSLQVIQPTMFEAESEDSIQFFLGSPLICPTPQWRFAGSRREIDFKGSYAIQLVPSLLCPDSRTLLQGRLAMMHTTDYDDAVRAAELRKLFGRLKSELRRNSDRGHVVVQHFSNGESKRWVDMLIGKSVPSSGLVLKQFAKGKVDFSVEPA